MSRSKALANITIEAMKKDLAAHAVKLIGDGSDEAPFLLKDINEGMQSQTTLVDVPGKFLPKIVQMDVAKHKTGKIKGERKHIIVFCGQDNLVALFRLKRLWA